MIRNTDANKRKLLEILKQTPLIQAACQKLGISRATYYRWFNDDDDFREAATQALYISGGIITDLAQSRLIELVKQDSLPAIVFWLSRRSADFAQQPLQPPRKSEQRDPVEALLREYRLMGGQNKLEKTNRFLPKSNRKHKHYSGPGRVILDVESESEEGDAPNPVLK